MKKNGIVIGTVVAIVAIISGVLIYVNGYIPYKQAAQEFKNASSIIEEKNVLLKTEIDKAQKVVSSGEKPLEASRIDEVNGAIKDATAKMVVIPEMPHKTPEIIEATAKLDTDVDYSADISSVKEARQNLEDSIAQMKQLTNPSEDFVRGRIAEVTGVTGVQAATEATDRNGLLHKKGGYTSVVYFSLEYVNQNDVYGTDIVDKGTDCGGSIEVYETEEEAQTRDDYLANFDGSILSSGYHKVVGTCVFRVSDLLNASKQEEVFQNMYEKMIELR